MDDITVTIADLQKRIIKYNNQSHRAQDIAHDLVTYASRLMEMFVWGDGMQERGRMEKRFALCIKQVVLFAHERNIDLEQAFICKLSLLKKKYPICQVKGKATVK